MLQADALFGMWTAALAQGSAGTSAAFHAALQLLSSQQPTQDTLASKPAIPVGSQLRLPFPHDVRPGLCVPADGTAGMRGASLRKSKLSPLYRALTFLLVGRAPPPAEREEMDLPHLRASSLPLARVLRIPFCRGLFPYTRCR